MSNPKCSTCKTKMKKNGKTKAGTQRWRCPACGASSVRRIDNSAKVLTSFLSWLLSKNSIAELKTSRSTFWRKCAWVWKIWPVSLATGEVFDVVHLDGFWLGRKAIVLIAWAEGHVIAWHLARSECAAAWAAIMARIPAPVMAVSDGSPGLSKAASIMWPETRIQRCTRHAAEQVRRCTTLKPKLEAGKELLEMANRLKDASNAEKAAKWLADYAQWCAKWQGFLAEFTFKDGKKQYVHRQLRKARHGLNALVREGTLFTFIEIKQQRGGEWPSTNNAIESMNARLREMLRLHRGLPLMHRIKAIMWWCYMHSESPLPAAEILRVMPTDEEVNGLFADASDKQERNDSAPYRYGSGIDWNEFHMPTEYRQ